jgi:type IV secretory pathway VirB2 component (pilin)
MTGTTAAGTRAVAYVRWTRRTPLAAILAVVTVVVVGLVAKFAVESSTDLTYELHWTTTMPVLIALLTLVINGEWNKRRAQYS